MSDAEQIENEQNQGEAPAEVEAGEPEPVVLRPWTAVWATGHDTSIALLQSLEWTRHMVLNTAEALALDPSKVTNFKDACEVLDDKGIGLAKRAVVLQGKQ